MSALHTPEGATSQRVVSVAARGALYGGPLLPAWLLFDELAFGARGPIEPGTVLIFLVALVAALGYFRTLRLAMTAWSACLLVLVVAGAVLLARSTPEWMILLQGPAIVGGVAVVSYAAAAALGAVTAAPGWSDDAVAACACIGLTVGLGAGGWSDPGFVLAVGPGLLAVAAPITGLCLALAYLRYGRPRRPIDAVPATGPSPIARATALGALFFAGPVLVFVLWDALPRLLRPDVEWTSKARMLRQLAWFVAGAAFTGAAATGLVAALARRGWPARIIARDTFVGALIGLIVGIVAAGPVFHGPTYRIPREVAGPVIGVLVTALRVRRPHLPAVRRTVRDRD